nr:hypothetical protein [Janthinobacterium violaceinigrum]
MDLASETALMLRLTTASMRAAVLQQQFGDVQVTFVGHAGQRRLALVVGDVGVGARFEPQARRFHMP